MKSENEKNSNIFPRIFKPLKTSWDDALPIPRLSLTSARVIVFILAVFCYANSYDGDFVFDDSEAIVGNDDLQPDTPVSSLLYHDFWGNKLNNRSHKSYRPLTVLTYRWNFFLSGGLFPMGFHIVNVILHGIVSLVFLSAFSVLLSHHLNSSTSNSKAAFLCAVLFAVHPVHSESVAGLVGRADLLCALFFLLSLLSYVKACTNDDNGLAYRPEKISWLWLGVSLAFCFLATFSKEQGITVIGINCAYDIALVSRIHPLQLFGLSVSSSPKSNGHNGISKNKEEFSLWIRSLLHRQVCLIISAVVLLLLRLQIMGLSPPTFQVHDNPHSFLNSSLYRSLNYNYLYAINSWLLLNPWWLCFDWSMGCVPTITNLADLRLVGVGVFWLLIGCLIYHSLRGDLDHEKRCLMLSLAFLVVPFLPASNLLFRVGFVIAERNLYLPSAGFIMLVALGAVRLSSHYQQVIKAGLYLLVVAFIFRSIQRSNHWRREITLYSEGEKVCPLNGKVHYNIAKLNGDKGNTEIAIAEYRRAIQLNPEYDQAMNNLANILKDRGDSLEAEELLIKAVTINPEFAAAWMNLGIAQTQLQKYEAAEKSYQTAIIHRRKYPDCYYNLGNLYLEQKRHQEALNAWQNATRQKPDHLNAWSNAAILLDNLGHFQQAVKMSEVALQYLPNAHTLWFNLANSHGKLEHWEESERCFLKAISLAEHEAKYHLNLGVLYHRWGKLDKAEKSYRTTLQLSPNNPHALENLQMLNRKRQNN